MLVFRRLRSAWSSASLGVARWDSVLPEIVANRAKPATPNEATKKAILKTLLVQSEATPLRTGNRSAKRWEYGQAGLQSSSEGVLRSHRPTVRGHRLL